MFMTVHGKGRPHCQATNQFAEFSEWLMFVLWAEEMLAVALT
jgi:hypothetical protein